MNSGDLLTSQEGCNTHDLQNLKVLDLFNSCNIYGDSVRRCEMLLVGEDVVCSANTIINGYHKRETAYDCCQALRLVKP